MGANSLLRRVVKKVIHPFMSERQYIKIVATTQARDIANGDWSEPELDLIPFAVKSGDTCLDLGANFGLYAYHLSKALKGNGKVYCFEPVPYTFNTLSLVSEQLNLENVELINKGCGDENGKVIFHVPLQPSGAVSAGQSHIGSRNDDRPGKEEQVRWVGTKDVECEIVRLDDFLPDLKNLTFIKADIEGAELFAFRGAEKIIDEFLPHVVCEIVPWFFDGFKIKLENLTDFFFDKGYKLFIYRFNEGYLEEVTAADVVEDNYIFIHSDKLGDYAELLK